VTQKKLSTSHVAERKYSEQPRLTVGTGGGADGVENSALPHLVELGRGSVNIGSNGAGKSAKGPGPNPL
jgi:3-hydroxyisobutyrate dehydrogenase-like beta-hydroxyacid dehydrogenase